MYSSIMSFLRVLLEFSQCKQKKRYTKSCQGVKKQFTFSFYLIEPQRETHSSKVRWSYLDLRAMAFLKTQEYFKFLEDLIKGYFGIIGYFCTGTYFHSEKKLIGYYHFWLRQSSISLDAADNTQRWVNKMFSSVIHL